MGAGKNRSLIRACLAALVVVCLVPLASHGKNPEPITLRLATGQLMWIATKDRVRQLPLRLEEGRAKTGE